MAVSRTRERVVVLVSEMELRDVLSVEAPASELAADHVSSASVPEQCYITIRHRPHPRRVLHL